MRLKDWYAAIFAGVVMGIVMAVLQLSGYFPKPQTVSAASGVETPLLRTLQSFKRWSSLQGEARLTQYDAANKPHLDIISVKVAQPLSVHISYKASDDQARKDLKWISDGNHLYEVNDRNLSYTESAFPGFAHNLNFIPRTLANVKSDEVYNHPFAMMISNPVMEYIYPVWFAQGASRGHYSLLGTEKIAGRATWKVGFRTDTDYVTAWIDQTTGVILKYRQLSGGKMVVAMEFIQIKFNQAMTPQTFSPPDTAKYSQVTHP